MALLLVNAAGGYLEVSPAGLLKVDNRSPFAVEAGGDKSDTTIPVPRVSRNALHRADITILLGRLGALGS